MGGYPPSHRSVDDPQPEVCDLCGLTIGGAHLQPADVEGLRGAYVCDAHRSCRMRSAPSYRDQVRTRPQYHSVGNSRIFPAGAKAYWNTD